MSLTDVVWITCCVKNNSWNSEFFLAKIVKGWDNLEDQDIDGRD
jgi:hypothetical protein